MSLTFTEPDYTIPEVWVSGVRVIVVDGDDHGSFGVSDVRGTSLAPSAIISSRQRV